jgi:hypothetical protein
MQSEVCINEGDALQALLFNFVMRIGQENPGSSGWAWRLQDRRANYSNSEICR